MCVNKIKKTGDSYLPCVAMAHSPQVLTYHFLHKFLGLLLAVKAPCNIKVLVLETRKSFGQFFCQPFEK
jgi:hypothetical protein